MTTISDLEYLGTRSVLGLLGNIDPTLHSHSSALRLAAVAGQYSGRGDQQRVATSLQE